MFSKSFNYCSLRTYIVILLALCSLIAKAEYAIIEKIVYDLNLTTLTATVLNFQDRSGVIVIPSNVYHKGDIYVVRKLSYCAFNTSVEDAYTRAYLGNTISQAIMGESSTINDIVDLGGTLDIKYTRAVAEREEPFRYNYDNVRSSIIVLQLPNTIESIEANAFDGMVRLRELSIPASVKELPQDNETVFKSMMCRLERLIIYGLPTYEYYPTGADWTRIKLSVASTDENGNYNYVPKIKEKFGVEECPNLKQFAMPEYEKIKPILVEYKKANSYLTEKTTELNEKLTKYEHNNGVKIVAPVLSDKVCFNSTLLEKGKRQAESYIDAEYQKMLVYSTEATRLYEIRDSLENILKKHPYYDKKGLSLFNIHITNDELSKLSIPQIKNYYANSRKDILVRYNKLYNGEMENYLRENKPKSYIEAYRNVHADKREQIDTLFVDYRCLEKKQQYQIILQYIAGKTLKETCKKEQWDTYKYLFKSENEFNTSYYANPDDKSFIKEIYRRKEAYERFYIFRDFVRINTKRINVKQLNTSPKYHTKMVRDFLWNFKKTYYYDDAIDFLISQEANASKEYQKQSKYFSSKREFFEAYISENYKTILKVKKQNKKTKKDENV